MAIRDLSPTQWQSPGTARANFGILLSAFNQDQLNLDTFLSIYSPSSSISPTLTTGNNDFDPDDYGGDNLRFILIVPPFGGSETIIVKWNTGDTGKYINPNGFYFDTFDPNHMPTVLRLVAGGDIAGCSIYWF